MVPYIHGRNDGWKVEGDQGLGPNTGALVPRAPHAQPKAGLGVGCGRGSPSPAVRVWGITPRTFLKTQMLNPAFWWLLAVNFIVWQLFLWYRGPRGRSLRFLPVMWWCKRLSQANRAAACISFGKNMCEKLASNIALCYGVDVDKWSFNCHCVCT